jgi:hypothetical protein
VEWTALKGNWRGASSQYINYQNAVLCGEIRASAVTGDHLLQSFPTR